MSLVLGIDAAWTARQPSGVALVRRDSSRSRWRCLAIAPSYDAFLSLAEGRAVDWSVRPRGTIPDPAALHAAAIALAGGPPDVVAIDMPLAARPITARRAADNAIASAYATRGLGTHSPSPERPGPIAHAMCVGFSRLGYAIATATTKPRATRVMIEVFPHASAISLASADYRVPYKLGRIAQYWPERTPVARRRAVLAQWAILRRALDADIAGIDLPRPKSATMAGLKRYEDALDALLCAWTGIAYLAGSVRAHGDATTAVWAP